MKAAERVALLERAEVACRLGSWDWDLNHDELIWSDNHFRLLGYEPGSVTPTRDLLVKHTHPADRDQLNATLDSLVVAGAAKSLRFRVIDAGGATRYMQATVVALEVAAGGPARIVGSVQDVTRQRHSDREIDARFAVSQALDEWTTFDESAENLLQKLGEAMDCCAGFVWLPVKDVVVACVSWHADLDNLAEFAKATIAARFPRGTGLPGSAWEAAEPVSLAGMKGNRNPARVRTAEAAGLRGAVAIPVMRGADLLAVVELYSHEETAVSDRLLHSLTGIGYELGHFLAGRRSELAAPELTPREIEVLRLATEGHSGPEIATLLTVSPATIKSHFEHIYDKLGVSDRAGAVANALRSGLIS